MADVKINRVDARVLVTDADALLEPDVLRRIARAVSEILEEERRLEAERHMDVDVTPRAARV